jgi:hypothetical protein
VGTQQLVKQSRQPSDRADVLTREAEVALRDAREQLVSARLRRIIQVKLRDGSLPHDGVPATIPGRPGDDSPCGACDHLVTSRHLMMLVPTQPPIPFHADCFDLWNVERAVFTPSS